MTGREKILNLLGIAYRARKVLCGDFAVSAYMQKSKVPLLFLASDSGKDNMKNCGMRCYDGTGKDFKPVGHRLSGKKSVVRRFRRVRIYAKEQGAAFIFGVGQRQG